MLNFSYVKALSVIFQIKWVFEKNLEMIFFLFLTENMCCDPSLELSQTVLMRGHSICVH